MNIEEMKMFIKKQVIFKDPLKAWENIELMTVDQLKRLVLIIQSQKQKMVA